MSDLEKRDVTKLIFKAHEVPFDSAAFTAFWELDYSIIAIKDEHCPMAVLMGDMFNAEVNSDIPALQLKREEKAYKARIRKEGVWGLGLTLRGEPLWHSFTYGFVGDDFVESGHDLDLLRMLSKKPVQEEL